MGTNRPIYVSNTSRGMLGRIVLFMLAILTFILFFVYFPLYSYKSYLGPRARRVSAAPRNLLLRPFRPRPIDRHCDGKSYEWRMFWNITYTELPPEWKILSDEKFICREICGSFMRLADFYIALDRGLSSFFALPRNKTGTGKESMIKVPELNEKSFCLWTPTHFLRWPRAASKTHKMPTLPNILYYSLHPG